MRAIVYEKFGPPDVLQLRKVSKPEPKDNEVLIKNFATTVVKEEPDWRRTPGFNGFLKPRNPILGQEFAGKVESAGKSVTRFKPGEQVFGFVMFGAYSEYLCVPEDGALTIMPNNMTYEEAASIPNGMLTALPFLRDKGHIQRGQSVLIYGSSGSVGTAAVQIAKYYGAEVTGVCSTANLELVKSLGADHVVDYTRDDFSENGKTYDIIFDTVGKRSFSDCKSSLTDDGIFLSTVPSPGMMLRALMSSTSGKRAGFLATGLRRAKDKVKDINFLRELIETGKIKAVIDKRFSLDQIADAHRYVETGRKRGNVVVVVRNDGEL